MPMLALSRMARSTVVGCTCAPEILVASATCNMMHNHCWLMLQQFDSSLLIWQALPMAQVYSDQSAYKGDWVKDALDGAGC